MYFYPKKYVNVYPQTDLHALTFSDKEPWLEMLLPIGFYHITKRVERKFLYPSKCDIFILNIRCQPKR